MNTSFTQEKQRDIQLIQPDSGLKNKVGHGGLNQNILEKAQKIIDENTIDFMPIAMRDLSTLQETLKIVKSQQDKHETDSLVAVLGIPVMQLKANGSMFGYPLITKISSLMIRFLETVDTLDNDTFDVIAGFLTSYNAVLIGNIRLDDATGAGDDLYNALEDACQRHLNKIKNSD